MESDFRHNLFSGTLAHTELSRKLKQDSDVRFVDYHLYEPSNEIAAFFVSKIVDQGRVLGWVVFQFSVNEINTTLANYEGLGRTGEIYLTNRQKLMITQSRLLPQDQPMALEVDTLALKLAFENESGNAVIEDYRGKQVFSSYERFSFADATWVIVAEIDEDEVITEFYRRNKANLLDAVFERLEAGEAIPKASEAFSKPFRRVDINEFGRVGPGEAIATHGVATCTGISITHPGKFTYLGHIFPLDAAYLGWWDRLTMSIGFTILEADRRPGSVDLVEAMLRRILRYDIYPFEIENLRAEIFAVHSRSFERIIDRLMDAGLFVSQITLALSESNLSVSAVATGGNGITALRWADRNGAGTDMWSVPRKGLNLGTLVKAVSGY